MANAAEFPVREDIVTGPGPGVKLPWRITEKWRVWLRDLLVLIQSIPAVVTTVALTTQSASIGTTAIPTASLAGGLYRVSWYAAITTAAAVNSSLTVTVSWTDGGIAKSLSGAAITGNTTSTVQSQPPLPIHIDANSPVSYSTVYASNVAGTMVYALDVVLEAVQT